MTTVTKTWRHLTKELDDFKEVWLDEFEPNLTKKSYETHKTGLEVMNLSKNSQETHKTRQILMKLDEEFW